MIRLRPFFKQTWRLSGITVTPNVAGSSNRMLSNEVPNSPQQAASDETVGFVMGSVVADMRKSLARYMARNLAAKNLYENSADTVQYEDFFKACNMPDTFQSWFYVMQLHLWMILVRLRSEGSTGKSLSYSMVEIMWQDIDARVRLLDVVDTSQRKETMEEFAQQFFGLVVAYDEGLLGHDRVLASALWRNLFYNKANTDAEKLALMVGYVRKQIQHLENQCTDEITMAGKIDWLPLYEEKKS